MCEKKARRKGKKLGESGYREKTEGKKERSEYIQERGKKDGRWVNKDRGNSYDNGRGEIKCK